METQASVVYATQPVPLTKQVTQFLDAGTREVVEGDTLAVIVPDSNLLTGGPVSAKVFGSLQGRSFDQVIVIGPSHTGTFKRISVCSLDTYVSPLGNVPVSGSLRDELCDEDDDIFQDDTGHFQNKGVDSQLPFLQTVLGDFAIVPIIMGAESPEYCSELGHAVAEMMFNTATLLVVCLDVASATDTALKTLADLIVDLDADRISALLNREDDIEIKGKGALCAAVIAASARRANTVQIMKTIAPTDESPGFIGAVISRA